MSEEPEAVTVAMRVTDLPRSVEGSVKRECEECGKLVWVSPATRFEMKRGIAPTAIWCVPCAVED